MRLLVVLLFFPAVVLAAPVPKPEKDESKLYLTIAGKITRMSPDGTGQEVVCDKGEGYDDSLSPDGKLIAAVKRDNNKAHFLLTLREPGGEAKDVLRVSNISFLRWARDGKKIYGTEELVLQDVEGGQFEVGRKCWRYDVATGRQTELDIPKEYDIWQETADGKGLLCIQMTSEQRIESQALMPKVATVVTPIDKFEPKIVIPEEVNVVPKATFPDGKRWVVIPIQGAKRKVGVFTRGEKKPEWWETEVRWAQFAVSPNGERVAYSTKVTQDETSNKKPDKTELWLADADGKNAKKILTSDKDITRLDWR